MTSLPHVEHRVGFAPVSAGTETISDLVLDREIFTAVLIKALKERNEDGGSLARRLGVGGTALGILLMLYVPGHSQLLPSDYAGGDEAEEQGWVRELLEHNRSSSSEQSRWLAAIVARRALEANHLWEDLGLPDRPTLTRLMRRHFGPLAELNDNNMRWKRFLYRRLCEDEGLVHCTSPTCSECADIHECFAPQSAESMIAQAKRAPVC